VTVKSINPYIPGMKINLISVVQWLEKDYTVIKEEKVMKIYDSNGKLILKVQMSNNRTFKIELDIMEHRCFAPSEKRGEWLLNYRLGHLNFRDLSLMEKKRMVSGLPSIKLPSKVCEECVQARQHRNILSKDA
jgi:hypothetical protein